MAAQASRTHVSHRLGGEDALILCADGLTGLGAAVEAVFYKAIFQACVVHLILSRTKYAPHCDLKVVCADLKALYTASNVEEARAALGSFKGKWRARYPHIAKSWGSRFEEWSPLLAFPFELRKAICTTNAIEALNRIVRERLKMRGLLPTDHAALRLTYLAIGNARSTWGGRHRGWSFARLQLVIPFEGRVMLA